MMHFTIKEAALLQLLYDRPLITRIDIQARLFGNKLRSSSAHRAQLCLLRKKLKSIYDREMVQQARKYQPTTCWWIDEADKPAIGKFLDEYNTRAEITRRRLEFLRSLRQILITSEGEIVGAVIDQMQQLLPQEKIDRFWALYAQGQVGVPAAKSVA